MIEAAEILDAVKVTLNKDLSPRQVGAWLTLLLLVLGSGWQSARWIDQYVKGIQNEILAHVDPLALTIDAHTKELAAHELAIDGLRKYGWTNSDMLRYGIQLDQGNRDVAHTTPGAQPGLRMPEVPEPKGSLTDSGP